MGMQLEEHRCREVAGRNREAMDLREGPRWRSNLSSPPQPAADGMCTLQSHSPDVATSQGRQQPPQVDPLFRLLVPGASRLWVGSAPASWLQLKSRGHLKALQTLEGQRASRGQGILQGQCLRLG